MQGAVEAHGEAQIWRTTCGGAWAIQGPWQGGGGFSVCQRGRAGLGPSTGAPWHTNAHREAQGTP